MGGPQLLQCAENRNKWIRTILSAAEMIRRLCEMARNIAFEIKSDREVVVRGKIIAAGAD